MKNYTYDLTVKSEDGNIYYKNENNSLRGYKKSWFKTEEAARKGLCNAIRYADICGDTVISWAIVYREHGVKVIESYKA